MWRVGPGSIGLRPYVEKAPIAAFFLGVSSGFPYAMIGATLTTRLAQDGIDKKSVTAFSLAFLVYNFKFLWAWLVDGAKIPLLGRLGQRVSWLIFAGLLGDRGGHQSCAGRSASQPYPDRLCRRAGRRGGRNLRHCDRRLSHRDPQAGADWASARA